MITSLLAMLRLTPLAQPVVEFHAVEKKDDSSTPLMRFSLAIMGIALVALLLLQYESLMASLAFVYSKAGLAMVGLIPLTMLTAFLLIYAVTTPNPKQPWVEGLLIFILDLGMLLGGFGTLDGLWRGMQEFSLDQGAEGLLHALPELIGGIRIMAVANLWSISLVILAVMLQAFLFGLKKEVSAANPDKASLDAAPQTDSTEKAATPKRTNYPVARRSTWQKNGN